MMTTTLLELDRKMERLLNWDKTDATNAIESIGGGILPFTSLLKPGYSERARTFGHYLAG